MNQEAGPGVMTKGTSPPEAKIPQPVNFPTMRECRDGE